MQECNKNVYLIISTMFVTSFPSARYNTRGLKCEMIGDAITMQLLTHLFKKASEHLVSFLVSISI